MVSPEKGVDGFIQMAVAVLPDGTVRMGNCPHCVQRRQRPPLNPTSGQPHPGDLLQRDDLLDLNAELSERLKKFGVLTSSAVFVDKTEMPRAEA
ncbi:MAG TPA: hypothetical protein VFA15_01950 [Nitrososphaera sp.]|nr:hypothetical protein [Nitrososphaera sp.]